MQVVFPGRFWSVASWMDIYQLGGEFELVGGRGGNLGLGFGVDFPHVVRRWIGNWMGRLFVIQVSWFFGATEAQVHVLGL